MWLSTVRLRIWSRPQIERMGSSLLRTRTGSLANFTSSANSRGLRRTLKIAAPASGRRTRAAGLGQRGPRLVGSGEGGSRFAAQERNVRRTSVNPEAPWPSLKGAEPRY